MKRPVDSARDFGPSTAEFVVSQIQGNLSQLPGDMTHPDSGAWQDSQIAASAELAKIIWSESPRYHEDTIQILAAQATRLTIEGYPASGEKIAMIAQNLVRSTETGPA